MSTKKDANSRQYARVMVDTTSATVDNRIQKRRRYLDEEASDRAPASHSVNDAYSARLYKRPTYERLRDQATDRTCQPHQRRQMLSQSQAQQERRPISTATVSTSAFAQSAGTGYPPQFHRPRNLGACHGYTEGDQIPCRQSAPPGGCI